MTRAAALAASADVPELSRSQLVVYGMVAVAILLLGARWIRSDRGERSSSGGLSFAADSYQPSAEGARDSVVHVTGAVVHPGVYRLPAGARVIDAVKRAGGMAPKADEDAINLAARLSDGQQVVVPARGMASAS